MEIPNSVSYQELLKYTCRLQLHGRPSEEIRYIIELSQDLCRLIEEVNSRQSKITWRELP